MAELRRALDLTQEQLAERLEVSPRYLQNVEAGRENLSLETLARLAGKLGVDAAALLEPPVSKVLRRAGRPPRRADKVTTRR